MGKLLKMTSYRAWVERSKDLTKEGVERKRLKRSVQNCLIKSRKCFVRSNICNHFKLLQDNYTEVEVKEFYSQGPRLDLNDQ